jgi:Tfp pilus assembly protein PilN
MINVNLVPEEYIQNNESRRTNFLYIGLLLIVTASLAAVYITLTVQYRRSVAKEDILNSQMAKKKEQIRQVEQLQEKRNVMWKTALTTTNLIEPVSKSVVLASLINKLPANVSFIKLDIAQKLVEKEPVINVTNSTENNKYQQEIAKKLKASQQPVAEKVLETGITIEGTAPSDLDLAHYIENLLGSSLFTNIALVESKEFKLLDSTFRQFKVTAKLCDNIHLDDEKIEKIKFKPEKAEKEIAKKISKNQNIQQ